ncbi:MAG TPA: hypothetical protein DHV28_15995 [Ignavibacteriales bacterium]|nr:hypothetical protein [Ignavibacteriales bacterium]
MEIFNISFKLSLSVLMINFFCSSLAQEYENDGVIYKNFILNSDSLQNVIGIQYKSDKSKSVSVLPYIKEDFLVNTLDGEYGCDQDRISTAVDGNGNRACVWLDERNERPEMFAQFYDANGNKRGANFKINFFELFGNNSPFVTANENGDFIITYLINFSSVVAQKFSSSGQQIGGSLIVNTTTGYNTKEPCAAVNDDGSYMIMWASEQGNSKYKVYARLVDNFGNFAGPEITVSDENKYSSSIGRGKNIAVDQYGNYCLTWSAYDEGSRSKVFLQLIDSYGNMIGGNILVSEDSSTAHNFFPQVASVKDGTFLFAWRVDNNWPSYDETGIRIYNINNGFITDVIYRIDSTNGYGLSGLSSDKQHTFYWLTSGYTNPSIIKLNSNGTSISETSLGDFRTPDLNYSYLNGITDAVTNRLYISMIAYRKTDLDVFCKGYDTTITALTELERVNDDTASSIQKYPTVAYNKFGHSIVLWEDRRNGWRDLYAQVYDENYNPINSNLKINDGNSEQWFLNNKIVKSQSDGAFVIAFAGAESSSDDEVYLQKISSDGAKLGTNLLIKSIAYNTNYQLAMEIDSTDESLIVFYTRYGASIKRFDKNLNQTFAEKFLMKNRYPLSFSPFTISIDPQLNILAVWQEYDHNNQSSDHKIFGQFFDRNANPASTQLTIDSTVNYILDVKCQNYGLKDYVLVFKDQNRFNFIRSYYVDGQQTKFVDYDEEYSYRQTNINIVRFENQKVFLTYNLYDNVCGFYANDNKRKSKKYELFKYPYINYFYDDYNGINGVDIFDGRLIFVYESNRFGNTNSDIWSFVKEADELNFDEELFFEPVISDYLYNNFPNPFSSKTKIIYELLAYHKVKLAVYNLLGEEVKVLVDQNQEKGIYEIQFDASSLSSGVYFYRLEAFDTTIKKMLILK